MHNGVSPTVTRGQALPKVVGLAEERPLDQEVHPGTHLVPQLEIQALEEVLGLAPFARQGDIDQGVIPPVEHAVDGTPAEQHRLSEPTQMERPLCVQQEQMGHVGIVAAGEAITDGLSRLLQAKHGGPRSSRLIFERRSPLRRRGRPDCLELEGAHLRTG
jgi:hypothetical protein